MQIVFIIVFLFISMIFCSFFIYSHFFDIDHNFVYLLNELEAQNLMNPFIIYYFCLKIIFWDIEQLRLTNKLMQNLNQIIKMMIIFLITDEIKFIGGIMY